MNSQTASASRQTASLAEVLAPQRPVGRFKAYPAYKDSGVEWVGEIPAHWGVKRLKFVAPARLSKLDTKPDEVPYVGLENVESWTGRLLLDTQPESVDSTVVTFGPEDVIFGKLRPYLAKVARPSFAGVCTSEIVPLRPAAGHLRDYLFYGLLSAPLIRWLDSLTYGARMPRVSLEQLAGTFVPVAPAGEQRAIGAFLDRETMRIDALVGKNEELIALLQEKRTALITRVVTKGLDPNAPMKDSGIEWLGEIPAHWDCLALARVTLSRCDGPFGSGLKSEHYSDDGVRVVRLQNIGWAEFVDLDRAYIGKEYAGELGEHDVVGGDLLISGLGDEAHPVGRACVAPPVIEPAMVKADCFRFRLDQRQLIPRFAAYQLSATATAAAGSMSTGATRSRMNLSITAARKITVPPLQEQHAIVRLLDRDEQEFRAIVGQIRDAIDRLRELRTALISAAVTGKIDVREEVA